MQELGTDMNLYALVFGESVLNDAVSICVSGSGKRICLNILLLTLFTFFFPWFSYISVSGMSKMAISLYRFDSIAFSCLLPLVFEMLLVLSYIFFNSINNFYSRTMSTLNSHEPSNQNFFMIIVRFLETFVGSMSSGQYKLYLFFTALSLFNAFHWLLGLR